jgi:Flp pilus assembly protein TadD
VAQRRVRLQALLAAALVVAVLVVYWPVREHSFLDYDDLVYRAQVEDGLSWESAARAFSTPYFSNWIPLTTLSLLADQSLHGDAPAGWLLTNVALHALASALLFAALTALTGAVWCSAAVAAVFALHPLHVEAVAWLSQRKDVLSGLFFAATLLAYAHYARRPSVVRALGVAVLTALGLLAKPMLVTLPCVLLLLDFWPLRRLGSGSALFERRRVTRAIVEKLPLFALALAVGAIAYAVQRSSPAMSHGELLPFRLRAGNALLAYVDYLRDAFWPTGLAAFYPYPVGGIPAGRVALAGGLLLCLTAIAVVNARRRPYLSVGWLWYLGMLVPVIGLVQVGMQARADRYTYLPLIGVAIAGVWGLAAAIEARPRLRPAGVTLAALVLGALALAARAQVGTWRNTQTVFSRAAEATADNYFAQHALGRALARAGRLEDAAAHLDEAIRLRPGWVRPLLERAAVHAELGETELAIARYERALALDPEELRARINLGRLLLVADRSAEARRVLEAAQAAVDDGAPLATAFRIALHQGLARARAAEGDLAGAVPPLEGWVRLEPENPEALERLGLAELRAGRVDTARTSLERARELGADSADLYRGLALVASAEGRAADAIRFYRDALARAPDDVTAANNLAWILATHPDDALRDPSEALELAEAAAVRTRRRDPRVIDTLAAAYAALARFDQAAPRAARAARLADEAGDGQLAAEIREREALYRSERPYRGTGGTALSN